MERRGEVLVKEGKDSIKLNREEKKMKQRTQRKRKECIKTRKETCRSGRQGGYLKMACVTGKQTILTLFNRVEIAREKRRES